MTVHEFHTKIKQHCDKLSGECQKCCFMDYCYSQKRDVYGSFLDTVITRISESADIDTDIDVQVIRNQNNVFRSAENSEHK